MGDFVIEIQVLELIVESQSFRVDSVGCVHPYFGTQTRWDPILKRDGHLDTLTFCSRDKGFMSPPSLYLR